MRVLVMPFGRRIDKPSDKLEHEIAMILQTPTTARSRLGDGQYLTREKGNLFGDLEQTLDDVIAAQPVFDKICEHKKAKLPFTRLDILADEGLKDGVINEEEAELLRRTEAGRLQTINVDDFDHEELIANQASKKSPGKKAGKAA